MNQNHVGSDFDDFLREERLLDTTEAAASKRVIAFQIEQAMKKRNLSKSAMASRMKTSRAALDRLLDPANTSVTLASLGRAAAALGTRLKVEFDGHVITRQGAVTKPRTRPALKSRRIVSGPASARKSQVKSASERRGSRGSRP